jgi:hypothetical protein
VDFYKAFVFFFGKIFVEAFFKDVQSLAATERRGMLPGMRLS